MPTRTITFSLPEELAERIDSARGDIPRSRFIRRKIEVAFNAEADPRGVNPKKDEAD